MKHKLITIAAAIAALCSNAAVPVRWTVETSRVEPVNIEAYHGETLILEATLKSYGADVDISGKTANLFFRTADMPFSVYWIAPATVTNGTIRATFDGSLDPGENRLYGFLGVQGENYRASFSMRLLHSPGWTPSAVSLPTKHLDFSYITVTNAPYYTKSETDAAITNKVTKDYIDGLGISSGHGAIPDYLTGDVTIHTFDEENEGYHKIGFEGAGSKIMTIDPGYDFGGVIVDGALVVGESGSLVVGNGSIVSVDGERSFSDYGLGGAADGIVSIIPSVVTNVSRSVQNTIYDASLGVTWRLVMNNGHLYSVAVTNANTTVIGR